jgi:N-carbamoyl-L-amino-acid hydrolase
MNPELKLEIDRQRLQNEIDTLAGYSSEPPPVVTRVVYSPADQAARRYLNGLFAEAGLSVCADAVGNTFARWFGSEPALPPVGTGSHIDAIPNAGRYDGTIGVLGALEAVRALKRASFKPRRSIEILLFTAEEPTRFGIGCPGSRILSGALSAEAARNLRDSDGASLDELRAQAGLQGSLDQVALPTGYYAHFVELHIEQGPILERESLSIGIVQSIAAPAALNITIEGEGGHAGTVLMPDRKDAFSAAAELALAVESLTCKTGGINTVATIGKCDLFPGAVNSIPSRVRLTLDLRDTDGPRRDAVLQSILEACKEIAARRAVKISTEQLNADAPAACSPRIVDTIRAVCEARNIPCRTMVSRAYHDTLFMARIAPSGMIFIPCRNGFSHRPDEYSSPEQIATGALVLAETLAQLASDAEEPA